MTWDTWAIARGSLRNWATIVTPLWEKVVVVVVLDPMESKTEPLRETVEMRGGHVITAES